MIKWTPVETPNGPSLAFWVTELSDVRRLIHPGAPKGSVILEKLDRVIRELQEYRCG